MYFVASSSWAEWKAKRWWCLLNCSASFAVWGKNVEWVDFWCYGRWNPSVCIENCDACFRKSAAKVFKDVNCETIPLCSNFPPYCWHFSSVQFLSPQHLIDGYLAIANNLQVPLENNLTVRLTVTVKPPKKCHVKDIEKSHFSIPLLMWRISFSSLSSLISNIRSLVSSVPTCKFISISCLVRHEMHKCLGG